MSNQKKPIVSWYQAGDPTKEFSWVGKLTDINVINTKIITDDFIRILLENKHRIFLHFILTGLNSTVFEPKIPPVRDCFYQLKKLIDYGFPQKQILVEINPIIPNRNGIAALKLILKLFTEYRDIRLRFIRFQVLGLAKSQSSGPSNFRSSDKTVFKNKNLNSRGELFKYKQFFANDSENFWKDYYNLMREYSSIITIDKGDESIIGVRELLSFGYKNEWTSYDENGLSYRDKIIHYEKGNKYKPIVNDISGRKIRCANRCLLCPWPDVFDNKPKIKK